MTTLSAEQRFSVIAITSAAALCVLIALFNAMVDPYGFYRPFESGIEQTGRPAIYQRVRLTKAYDLRRIKPAAIVLGTSRSQIGLRMTHPGWSAPSVFRYNSAFDGATTQEMYAYLLHAEAIKPLRQVVLGLDTWQLNRWAAWTRPDFDPALLFHPGRPLHNAGVYAADLGVLVSVDTTEASFVQLRSNGQRQPQWFGPDGQRLGEVFFRQVESNFTTSPGAFFRSVDRQEIGFMLDTRPIPISSQSKFGPDTVPHTLTSLEYIAKIVSFCRDQHIDLRIFLTPAHAHQLETVAELGGWQRLEQGKRDLVDLLADDAASHPGASAFPLYDFSSYSSVTTEPVPPAMERREMEFYWDSSHFKDRVGNWVLDRLFETDSWRDPPPPDFGVRLTRGNIEAELERSKVDRRSYQREHRDDVTLIKTLIAEVKAELARRDGKI